MVYHGIISNDNHIEKRQICHAKPYFPYAIYLMNVVIYPPVSSIVATGNPLGMGGSVGSSHLQNTCIFHCHVYLEESTSLNFIR